MSRVYLNTRSVIKHGKSIFSSKCFHHECIEQKHSNVRNMAKDVEILAGKSTAQGGLCWIYLHGVFHRSERSKSEARSLVNYLKPDVLFLEVCRQRKEDMLRTPESEFNVAYMEAKKYNTKVILGDMDIERREKVRDERVFYWIMSRPHKKEAWQMTFVDDRNKYMIDGIKEISKKKFQNTVLPSWRLSEGIISRE